MDIGATRLVEDISMRRIIVAIVLSFCFQVFEGAFAASSIRVQGRVTNSSGKPLAGADVYFQDVVDTVTDGKSKREFKTAFSALTNSDGKFEVEIENRTYDAVFISKNYHETPTDFLEFWFWNYQPELVPSLDVFIDGLEAYGLKTWVDFGAKANIVFVRPMSLKKGLPYRLGQKPVEGHVPIAPTLLKQDVEVTVDGVTVPVWGLNNATETVSPGHVTMDAFLITIPEIKPKVRRVLCLKMHDRQNGERGMGCLAL
jgi:hypothetical protein